MAALEAIAKEVPEAVVGPPPGRSLNLPRSSRFSDWEQSSPSAPAARRLLSPQPGRPAAAGGLGWLKAVGAPLAGLSFCPTGGVGAETAPAYLSLSNVACVGGSWVAPRAAVNARDWSQIERLAAAASKYKRS